MVRARTRILFAPLLLCAAAWLLCAPARGQTADPPATAPRVGFYVFISAQSDVEASLAPGELRSDIESRLGDALARGGAVVYGAADLEPAVRRHRVRTSMLASVEFLAELTGTPGLDALNLVDLVILPNNVLMTVREVAVPSGMLLDVRLAQIDLTETEFAAGDTSPAARWRESLARLCADVGTSALAPAPQHARTLAVLPFQGFGTGTVTPLATTMMLLRTVLADSSVAVPDPALVVTTLQRAGLESHMLSAEGRTLIAERFPCERIIHPVVLSYAPVSSSTQLDIPDFEDPVHSNVLLGSGMLALWSVNLQNGELDGAAEVFFEVRRETGWFGIPDKRSPVTQLETAITQLWHDFVIRREES